MNLADHWQPLTGAWSASNAFRMMPEDEYATTSATLDVSPGPGPSALCVRYTWQHEGVAQDGVLVVAAAEPEGAVQAVWLDSFHQQPAWMELAGHVEASGRVQLVGTYGDGAWGWRIALDPSDGLPEIVMDNVPPGADPYPVVHLIADPR
jgi:hypothetical protein